MFESSVWLKTCLVAGTLIIGAYVIFGGTSVSRRRRRRKDGIPGLANIGNSCFLNALVQSLASCPVFVSWLSTRHTERTPPLLNTLQSLLKALNNEGETSGDACAGEVLGALRGHGWVITSEEQDTHELFHVLTTTIEDEIISGAPVPSLLDVSWLDGKRDVSNEGVALRAAVWRLNTTDNRDTHTHIGGMNGVLCGNVRDLSRFGLCEKGEGNERCLEDGDGCEFRAMLNHQGTSQYNDTINKDNEIQGHNVSIRYSTIEPNDQKIEEEKSQGRAGISIENSCVMPPECDDNKNVKHDNYHLKTTKGLQPQAVTTQGPDNVRKKTRSESQQDIPFRGYLASQLQCTVCGHKNPAQWSTFESLSLSLPSLPWGEVSLQELLGTYITREQVSEVSCEACTRKAPSPVKTTFTKQLTIGKLPDCLCFHVKRTVWLENGTAIKRRDHVTFPEFLVMDPYTYTTSITNQQGGGRERVSSEGSNGSKLLDNHNITTLSQGNTDLSPIVCVASVHYDQLYKLQAVIVHVGDVFCGHFVTYRRGPVNSRSKTRWFYTSDLLVREASLEEFPCCYFKADYQDN